jgi:hypothetical protein
VVSFSYEESPLPEDTVESAVAFLNEMGSKEGWRVIGERDGGRKTKRYTMLAEGSHGEMGTFSVTEDPIRRSFDELKQDYAKYDKEWKESACWAEIQEVLKRLCRGDVITIDRYLLFGPGSPSGGHSDSDTEGIRARSLTQVAVFVSVAQLIGKMVVYGQRAKTDFKQHHTSHRILRSYLPRNPASTIWTVYSFDH